MTPTEEQALRMFIADNDNWEPSRLAMGMLLDEVDRLRRQNERLFQILGLTTMQKRDLLKACKAQHLALDMLLAERAHLDPAFFPKRSPAWNAVVEGNQAIEKAEGR